MSSPAAACWTKRVMPTTEACARCAEPKASQTNTPSQRSEEHTSELQSRLHLVCRLLLEKKNSILHRRTCSSQRPRPPPTPSVSSTSAPGDDTCEAVVISEQRPPAPSRTCACSDVKSGCS